MEIAASDWPMVILPIYFVIFFSVVLLFFKWTDVMLISPRTSRY